MLRILWSISQSVWTRLHSHDILGTPLCGHFALYFHMPIFPIFQEDSPEQELCLKYLSITMLAIESDDSGNGWMDECSVSYSSVEKMSCLDNTASFSFFSKDGESSDPNKKHDLYLLHSCLRSSFGTQYIYTEENAK